MFDFLVSEELLFTAKYATYNSNGDIIEIIDYKGIYIASFIYMAQRCMT